ncbi:hypothetical protein D3C75_613560 [compost metagenome]
MEDPFTARREPFGGAALAATGLDHFQVQVAPARKRVSVGDFLHGTSVAAGVMGVESTKRSEPEQGLVMFHACIQIAYDDSDLIQLAFKFHTDHASFEGLKK